MMSQFSQDFVDASGHFPSSFQPTWGGSQRFTALDWSRRSGHVQDGERSILGHCPSKTTFEHCLSQGYSFYPIEAPPGHSLFVLGNIRLATSLGATSLS